MCPTSSGCVLHHPKFLYNILYKKQDAIVKNIYQMTSMQDGKQAEAATSS